MDSLQLVIETAGQCETISVGLWSNVMDVKKKMRQLIGAEEGSQRLFFKGQELLDAESLQACSLESGDKIFLSVSSQARKSNSIDVYGSCPCTAELLARIESARQGLGAGLAPRLAMEGIGGTYFLRNAHKQYVAVFKPGDEEPFTPHNPKGYIGAVGQQSMRPGVLSGEGHLREVAAFMLDHGGFSGVPMTTLAEMASGTFHHNDKHISSSKSGAVKLGALQEFVHFDEMAGDMAPQKFAKEEVHKIGILDLRLCNTDRNDANILVIRDRNPYSESAGTSGLKLVPIDHSYCLPDTLEVSWADWVWFDWPQAKEPFSTETLSYISNLDVDADVHLLRTHLGIREECLLTLRITTTLLQRGAAAGLTLYEISNILLRDDLDLPSLLEVTCAQARALARTSLKNTRLNPKASPSSGSSGLAVPRGTSNSNSESLPVTLAPLALHRSASNVDIGHSEYSSKGFGVATIVEDERSMERTRKVGLRRQRSDMTPSHTTTSLASVSAAVEPAEAPVLSQGASVDSFVSSALSGGGTHDSQSVFFHYLESLFDQVITRIASKASRPAGSRQSPALLVTQAPPPLGAPFFTPQHRPQGASHLPPMEELSIAPEPSASEPLSVSTSAPRSQGLSLAMMASRGASERKEVMPSKQKYTPPFRRASIAATRANEPRSVCSLPPAATRLGEEKSLLTSIHQDSGPSILRTPIDADALGFTFASSADTDDPGQASKSAMHRNETDTGGTLLGALQRRHSEE